VILLVILSVAKNLHILRMSGRTFASETRRINYNCYNCFKAASDQVLVFEEVRLQPRRKPFMYNGALEDVKKSVLLKGTALAVP